MDFRQPAFGASTQVLFLHGFEALRLFMYMIGYMRAEDSLAGKTHLQLYLCRCTAHICVCGRMCSPLSGNPSCLSIVQPSHVC